MEKLIETKVENDNAVAEIFASIPANMLGTRKSRHSVIPEEFPVLSIKYDNPQDAIAAFELSKTLVERKPFEAPKAHTSQVYDKPFVKPPRQSERSVRATIKYHQEFFAKANAQLKRKAVKEKKTLVYDRLTSSLSFSGSLEEAVAFILNKTESGEWDDNSWAIYLPK